MIAESATADFGSTMRYGALAQLGERRLCKPEVTGSIPVRSTIFAAALSAAARLSPGEPGFPREPPRFVDALPAGDGWRTPRNACEPRPCRSAAAMSGSEIGTKRP
jgi:hypothetical protein